MIHDIDPNFSGEHRDTQFYQLVTFPNNRIYVIDGIRVVVARLMFDNNWWIIPNSHKDEDRFTDLGPYNSIEEALMYLRLHGDERTIECL